jgi:hypothetical protein
MEIIAADRLADSAVQSTSVLAQRFTDPALGELVLARDALGVDAQQHITLCPAHSATWVG